MAWYNFKPNEILPLCKWISRLLTSGWLYPAIYKLHQTLLPRHNYSKSGAYMYTTCLSVLKIMENQEKKTALKMMISGFNCLSDI